MIERPRTLTVKMTDEELERAHALAAAGDESVGRFVRRVLADHYRAKFGDAPPPSAKARFGRPRKETTK